MNTQPADLIWGARAIGEVIGRSAWDTNLLLNSGHIKPARQVGRRWVVSRAALLKFFNADEHEAA
jgi:hypothetical protein